jgi:putative ABC transport system permease protein
VNKKLHSETFYSKSRALVLRNREEVEIVKQVMQDHLFGDLRLAFRSMWRQRAISLLLVVTLGLGLGANIAIFTILDAMLLRPLDFPNVDRLVRIWETSPGSDSFEQWNISPANFLDFQEQSRGALEALLAVEYWSTNLRGSDTPERVSGFKVSPEFFRVLGVNLHSGRGFLAEEGNAGAAPSAVIGHGLWQRAFGGASSVIGQSVVMDGVGYTVVGIAPEGFHFPEGAEVWSPLVLPAPGAASRDRRFLTGIGFLRPGASIDRVRAEFSTIAKRLETAHPTVNKGRTARVEALNRGFEDQGLRPVLGFFQLGAGLVLLIACINVANFLLARGAERRREIAVRSALGAAKSRILGQLLTEGLVTALMAMVVALPTAALAARAMKDMMPVEIARFLNGWSSIDLDGRAVFFGLALATLSALVFSLAPARRASNPDLTDALKEGGRASTEGASRQRGRSALVVSQIAAALALVLVASLAARSAWTLIEGPQGYEPENLLALDVSLPEGKYPDPETRRTFVRESLARLSEMPGVTTVAATNVLPARNSNSGRKIRVEGDTTKEDSELLVADSRTVTPAFFETMKLPMYSGRAFDARDDASQGALPVAVVSRAFAERHWPGVDPIGRRFRAGESDAPMVTVIGVCGDVVHQWFGRRNYPTYYRPYAQEPRLGVTFAVRTSGDPEGLAQDARRAVAAADPYQPAYAVWSMKRSIANATIGLRFVAGIMTILSGLALLLALTGVYGVMAYRVSLRTLEIGVRVVLGASRGDVLRLTMGQAAWLTAGGLTLGGSAGVAMSRLLSNLLQGAVTVDVGMVLGFSGLLAAAALLAAYIPARRSLSVDPAQALRAE